MRTLLFVLSAALVSQTSIAQLTEGSIVYERKVNMHRRITDESQKALIPEFNTAKMQLDFSGSESIFKSLPEDEDIRDNAGNNGNGIVIRMGGVDNETYKNYATEKITELRELGPKKYIIEDTLRKLGWKLSEETKTVKGHTCKKATTTSRDSLSITAWYAEDIQSSAGPEEYGGLPGMILELNINDAEIVFTALDIVTKGFDKKIVKAPTNGKKVTRKEFQKMLDDEFGPNPNGGPTIRIIRN